MDDRIGFELYQSCGRRGSDGGVSVGLRWCGEWVGGLDQGLEGWGGVCMSCESG